LNLLLYFNKEWEPGWGGCLELHSNPRRPAENSVTTIVPTFNRCVLFETSELSWHGFERITLPDHAKHLSRKLLSIYLYTHDRPAEEIAPPHATFYVQRPMPQHLVPGYTLTPADIQQLHQLFRRRDDWIEFYQREELRFSTRIQELSYLENQFDVPVFGLAAQSSPSRGFWSDNWIGSPFEVSLRTSSPVRLITLQGDLPAQLSKEAEICVWIDGQVLLKQKFKPGRFNIAVRTSTPAGQHLRLKITSDTVHCPAKAGESEDTRELLALLKEIRVS
jgi:hypothetical protein